ncbi:hypothetical protein BT96DRAFT_843694, partial [Gymnopus androsaceus JB14]
CNVGTVRQDCLSAVSLIRLHYRSGIGSAEHLANAHVDQLVDLPGVGENYNDHNLCITPYLSSEDSDCLDGIFAMWFLSMTTYLAEWTEKGTGLLAHKWVLCSYSLVSVSIRDYPGSTLIKMRPTPKELEELGPSFKKIWQDFYIGAPDKAVALLCSAAG